MQFRRSLPGLLLGALLISCGDAGTGPQVPANIVILPNHPVVAQGDTLRLTATVVDANGAALPGQHATFSSADLTIATVVASTGLVTSVGAADTVRITASLGQLSSFVDLVVTPRAVSLFVSPDSIVINVTDVDQIQAELRDFIGQPVQPASPITFASSDTSVAKVDQSGLVYSTSQKTGTATITIVADTFVVNRTVHVVHFPANIVTAPRVVVLASGGTRQLSVQVIDVKGFVIPSPTVSFQSGTPALISVSPTGLVTSLGPTGTGSVIVTGNTVVHSTPVYVGTPPPGTLVNRVDVPGPAYASILSASGEMLVTLPTTSYGMRGNIAALNFSDTLTTLLDPLGVALDPTGAKAYVALRGLSKVGLVDLATSSVTLSGVLGAGGTVYSTAVSSDGAYLFVGTSNWLYRLNASSLAVIDSITASTPIHFAIHPTQNLLYVSNNGSGLVDEVDWTTMTVVRSFSDGGGCQALAIAPDGSKLYVANEAAGTVDPWDLVTGVKGTGTSITGAYGLALSGNVLYVSASTPGIVYGIDRTTGSPVFTLTVGGTPRRMAIGSDGILIVPNEGGWVDFVQ